MSIFSNGIATILGAMRQIKGESVTYTRSGQTPITITDAVPLKGENLEADAEEFTVAITDLDWAIERTILALAGVELEPRAGDRITWINQGKTLVYEVNSENDDQPWQWSDTAQTQRRIHTKLIRE